MIFAEGRGFIGCQVAQEMGKECDCLTGKRTVPQTACYLAVPPRPPPTTTTTHKDPLKHLCKAVIFQTDCAQPVIKHEFTSSMIPSRLPPNGQSKSQPNFIPHRKAAFTGTCEGIKSQHFPKPHEPHLSLLNRVTGVCSQYKL